MAHAISAAIERDQARRQLEASADLLRHSDDPIIVWTISEGVETWSEGAAELYGFSEEEALHRAPAELLGTSFPVPWREILEALRTNGSWEGELRKHGKDGQEVVLWSRLRLVVDPDGTERVLEVSRDVTSRKRMEDALKAAEARFRALYEAQQTAHLVLSPDFTIEAASPPYLEATMMRAEDLVGRNIFAAFPDNPEDPDATGVRNLTASLQRVLEMRRTDRMSVQKHDVRSRDGTFQTRWWAPLNIPVFAPDGRVSNIIYQVEDVTREMVERQKAAEAQAREARFRAAAEAIPALVFEADAEGRNTYVNEPFVAFTGLPRSALLGDGWVEMIHPEDQAKAAEAWSKAVRAAEFYEHEFRIRSACGAWRWFIVRANPIRDGTDAVEKWIGVCSDITERHELEELQRLMMSEISHRVKNSLTLVSSLLGLQARTLEDGPRAALDDASSRVRAIAMVHDQLWRHADAREIKLADFLSHLTIGMATTAPKHDTIVEVEPAIVSAEVAVPIGLFVNELVTNAYKYAYPEGEGGEVRVTGSAEEGGRYRLEVSDRGGGLPDGFDLGQASSSLGMRVITSLAKRLGGQLTVGSAEPGARFTLEFPLKPATSP
jgi:PAS domain S-box-containing protein